MYFSNVLLAKGLAERRTGSWLLERVLSRVLIITGQHLDEQDAPDKPITPLLSRYLDRRPRRQYT